MDDLSETATGLYLTITVYIVQVGDAGEINHYHGKYPSDLPTQTWNERRYAQQQLTRAYKYGKNPSMTLQGTIAEKVTELLHGHGKRADAYPLECGREDEYYTQQPETGICIPSEYSHFVSSWPSAFLISIFMFLRVGSPTNRTCPSLSIRNVRRRRKESTSGLL